VFRYQNIIILSSLIAALTSCSDDLNELYPASSRAISYSVEATAQTTTRATDCETFALTSEDSADTLYAYVTDMPSVITRGTPIENAAKLTEDITISAYYHAPSASSDDKGTTVFQDETLSAPDHNTLASGTKYYWPQSGSMDFYAIYPKVSTNNKLEYDADTKALTYTMPTDAKEQKDIMVAKKSYTMPTDQTTAELGFNHICAQLTFKLAGSVSENAIIENVTITNLKTKGTYSLTDGKWTNLDKTDKVSTGNIVKVTQIGGDTQTSKFDLKEKTLLLIPQELTSNSEIEVQVGEYETYTDTKTGVLQYKITNESVWTCNFRTFTMDPGGNYILEISKKGDIGDKTWKDKGNVVYEDFDSFYFIKKVRI